MFSLFFANWSLLLLKGYRLQNDMFQVNISYNHQTLSIAKGMLILEKANVNTEFYFQEMLPCSWRTTTYMEECYIFRCIYIYLFIYKSHTLSKRRLYTSQDSASKQWCTFSEKQMPSQKGNLAWRHATNWMPYCFLMMTDENDSVAIKSRVGAI